MDQCSQLCAGEIQAWCPGIPSFNTEAFLQPHVGLLLGPEMPDLISSAHSTPESFPRHNKGAVVKRSVIGK